MKLATVYKYSWCIRDGLLYGADDYVASWVEGQIDGVPSLPCGTYHAIGKIRDGELVGGIIYHSQQPREIAITLALDKVAVTPDLITKVFRYPFIDLQLPRVTFEIAEGNEKSNRLARGIGAVLEGRKRQAGPNGTDTLVYGMLHDEFRFKDKL